MAEMGEEYIATHAAPVPLHYTDCRAIARVTFATYLIVKEGTRLLPLLFLRA